MSVLPTIHPAPDQARDAGRADPLTRVPWTRSDLLVAGLLGLLVAALTWWLRTEIVSTDPWHYGLAAVQFPQDTWVPLGYTRYGMILPLVPLAKLTASAPILYWLPALVSSATIAATLYLLGRRWWGTGAALVAVALTLTNWVVFLNLSRFYPDLPSMALVLLALTLAVAARGRIRSGGRGVLPLLLGIGFLLGWSFEARETALFAWPPVIAVLWVRGRVLRNALLVALPVVAWAAVDVGVSALAYGDPLLKLHTFTRQDLSQTSNPADVAVMKDFIGLPRLDYLTMIPRLAIERHVPGGIFFLVLGLLALLALLVRNAAVRLSAAAFVISYVLFVGIAGFFFPAHPAGRLDVQRYWIQFVPWMALAAAGGVHVILRGRSSGTGGVPSRVRIRAATAVGLALVVASAWPTVMAARESPALAPNGGAPLAAVSGELQKLEADTVWTDWQTGRVLGVHRRALLGGPKLWSSRIRSLLGDVTPHPGDVVVLLRRHPASCGFCADALAQWGGASKPLPSTWIAQYISPGGAYTVYRVGS